MYVDTRKPVPRDFYISKIDAEKHGYTRGCAGCPSWFRGLSRQPHNAQCRERFRNLMREDAKVRNNEVLKREFENKMGLSTNASKGRVDMGSGKRIICQGTKVDSDGKLDCGTIDDGVEVERKVDKEEAGAEVISDGQTKEKRKSAEADPDEDDDDDEAAQEILKALRECEKRDRKKRIQTTNEDDSVDRESVDSHILDRMAEEQIISRIELDLCTEWIAEMKDHCAQHMEELESGYAWDDVHGGDLPMGEVEEARREEVGYME